MKYMKNGSLKMRIISAAPKMTISRDYSNLENTLLEDKTDYQNSEALVLECAGYLLDSPIDSIKADLDLMGAMQFILRWMEGTPYITFNLDDSIIKAIRSDSCLFGIYLASMVKYVLENKNSSGKSKDVKYNSLLIFISYIEDKARNIRLNKNLRAIITAKNQNLLKEYLSI